MIYNRICTEFLHSRQQLDFLILFLIYLFYLFFWKRVQNQFGFHKQLPEFLEMEDVERGEAAASGGSGK